MFDDRVIFARRVLGAAGLAAGLLVGLGGNAEAQFFGWWNAPTTSYGAPENSMISPTQIYRIVAERGYQVTGGLRRSGRVYMVDAIDRWGRPLRLVVDAYEGDILQRFATKPPRPAASVPQPQSSAELFPQFPFFSAPQGTPSYPATHATLPAATATREQPALSGTGQPASNVTHRKPARKTQTATRETSTPNAPGLPEQQPDQPVHALPVPPPARHTAHIETTAPHAPADLAPQPAGKGDTVKQSATPAPQAQHQNVTAAVAAQPAKSEPAVTVAPATPPAAPAKPGRPKNDGPGYANGVPINPLD